MFGLGEAVDRPFRFLRGLRGLFDGDEDRYFGTDILTSHVFPSLTSP